MATIRQSVTGSHLHLPLSRVFPPATSTVSRPTSQSPSLVSSPVSRQAWRSVNTASVSPAQASQRPDDVRAKKSARHGINVDKPMRMNTWPSWRHGFAAARNTPAFTHLHPGGTRSLCTSSRLLSVRLADTPSPQDPRLPQHRNIAVTANAPEAMYSQPEPGPGTDFNVVMIGAGNIMFGSDEGPWNHSFRFEHKLGPRLKVVALVDPQTARSETVLAGKRQSFVESAYRDTQVFKTIDEYHASVQAKKALPPSAIVVGCPPAYRGGTTEGTDLEINLIKLFPKTAYFIEKPVGTGTVSAARQVTKSLLESGNVVSVGYMLRYLRCVQKMKQIIQENGLTIMATNARYSCAYEACVKPAWWNKAIDMGPIIEQGTHFCDLSRYFGGDVDVSSVVARSVEFYEKPGRLSKMRIDEAKIPEELRIPRVTSAIWKYENGAVGSLTHTVALQGQAYACELEVWADGYNMRLVDPYNAPTLYVRRPGDDHEERHQYTDDDPFFSEVSSFVDCIEHGPDPHILSTFEDATKTYELTWAIRLASEAARAPMPSSA